MRALSLPLAGRTTVDGPLGAMSVAAEDDSPGIGILLVNRADGSSVSWIAYDDLCDAPLIAGHEAAKRDATAAYLKALSAGRAS